MLKTKFLAIAFCCTTMGGLAQAAETVTLPFELTAGLFDFDTATSVDALDAASEYAFTFELDSVTVMTNGFGIPLEFDAMTELSFVGPLVTFDSGTVQAPLPAAAHEAAYLIIDPLSQGVVGDIGIYFDIESDGTLSTALDVGTLGAVQQFFLAQSVSVTGTATASVVPAPGVMALSATGMLCLVGRPRRQR